MQRYGKLTWSRVYLSELRPQILSIESYTNQINAQAIERAQGLDSVLDHIRSASKAILKSADNNIIRPEAPLTIQPQVNIQNALTFHQSSSKPMAMTPTYPANRPTRRRRDSSSDLSDLLSYRRCRTLCSCTCHRRSRLKSPDCLEYIIGTLILNYSTRCTCNERLCRGPRGSSYVITYFFPYWLLARSQRQFIYAACFTGPTFALRMPRVVKGDSKLIGYSVKGDVEGIKELFVRGEASPDDVAGQNGRSALHVGFPLRRM